ncbi:HIT family protein [Deinococcus peraridilitoris]|uniref:HIT family hydrolase, diadenosine tetraphosphate hydrolase n=1 Tax=Deinococcus peraridilitoris (strain DSM 19664 / LMG 22246 / CIP 109416 / KR-200) TaxID=937777 RepID=L0A4F4_DEIPD|nr:HIT family protein [Deinococcus peraridilitoris]AFZ68057.1 HIT family hydrolase, diadenosine tetraphosphate hydrolase [Deinococcus peraridilitoris DSM 19664]
MRERRPFDLDTYVQRTRTGPCFICALLSGHPDYRHHVLYQDEFFIAFLAKSPNAERREFVQALGYVLIAPREHREHVTGDFTQDEYLRLQALVYRVGEALCAELPTERVYVLSLGSQQGNAHVHWHVVPLPPGVPYEQQQFHFLMAEHGVLEVQLSELDDLAGRLRSRLNA